MIRLLLLLLLAVHTAPADEEKSKPPAENFQINMTGYGNSTDDEFEGCKDEMYNRIQQLLSEELSSNGNFTNAWTKAKQDLLLGTKNDSDLNNEQLRKVAVRAYTGNHIYRELNDQMREGRDTYDQFGLKSLHFLITHDIQTLNPNGTCQTTYRRTTSEISITDTFVRFGSFASSSLTSKLQTFGNKTCFIITTCYGAQLDRPVHDKELEVLIPPYEVFIQDSKEDPRYKIKSCDRVYRLKSVGKISIMKCTLVKGPATDSGAVVEV